MCYLALAQKRGEKHCDINNPVGALMLSGEWGCGKTYLIKTKFIPSVKDTVVFEKRESGYPT